MNEISRYLCFGLGREEFAIPLLKVKEVLGYPEVTPLPQTSSYFLGIMDLRGSVVSILDLRSKLGFKPERTEETTTIILDVGSFNIGMVVDRVNSVVSIHDQDIDRRPMIENAAATEFVTGVFHKDNKLVIVLDLEKALSVQDKQTIERDSNKKAA